MGDPLYASDQRGVMQPFHIGPRNCLGRRYVAPNLTDGKALLDAMGYVLLGTY